MYLNVIFTAILTAAGDSKTSFQANVIGLIANIILDPLLIFGIGPVPALGAAGAAIATVTAQAIVTLVFLIVIRKDQVIFDEVNIFSKTPGRYFKTMAKLDFRLLCRS